MPDQQKQLDTALKFISANGKLVGGLTGSGGTAAASAIGWHVGIVMPGFLGLLWNGAALASKTRLQPEWYLGLFIASEMAFLGAIIVAVIGYEFFIKAGVVGTQMSNLLEAYSQLASLDAEGELGKAINTTREQARVAFEDMSRLTETVRMPAVVSAALSWHGWLTLAGYVLMGTIIATVRFHT